MLGSVSEAIIALLALIAAIAAAPHLRSRASLVSERDNAISRASISERALLGMQHANEGWQNAVDQLTQQIGELRRDVDDLRHKNVLQTKYICDLISFLRTGGSHDPMPPIPVELRDDISTTMGAV